MFCLRSFGGTICAVQISSQAVSCSIAIGSYAAVGTSGRRCRRRTCNSPYPARSPRCRLFLHPPQRCPLAARWLGPIPWFRVGRYARERLVPMPTAAWRLLASNLRTGVAQRLQRSPGRALGGEARSVQLPSIVHSRRWDDVSLEVFPLQVSSSASRRRRQGPSPGQQPGHRKHPQGIRYS